MGGVTDRYRRTLRRPFLQDGLIAAALVVLSLVAMWNPTPIATFDYREPDVLGIVLTVLATAPVAFRSRWPVAALLIVAAASLLHTQLGYPQGVGGLAALFPLYSVAVDRSLRVSAAMTALTAAGVVLLLVAGPYDATLSDWGSNLFVLAIAWLLGRSVRTRRARQADLELRNRALADAQEAETRTLVMEERARTAREMQDLVAHNLTEIGVQVAAARRLVRRDVDAAEVMLLEAERVSRAALDELRRVGGVLAEDEPAAREPQPDLEAVRRLVEHERAAGARVVLRTAGDCEDVPAGVALTTYRLVEELLGRLGPRDEGRAEVLLTRSPGYFTAEVTGTPGRSSVRWDEQPEPGSVATKLRDRVGVYGGELTVGRRRDGSVRVSARFPVREEARMP